MVNFDFKNTTRIIFGKGAVEKLGKIAEKTKKFDPVKGTVGNFYPLADKDIVEILKLAK